MEKAAEKGGEASSGMGLGLGAGFGMMMPGMINQAVQEGKKQAAGAEDKTKKCPKCQKDVAGPAKFCPECGAEFPLNSFCAKCGAALQAGAKFCPACGQKIT